MNFKTTIFAGLFLVSTIATANAADDMIAAKYLTFRGLIWMSVNSSNKNWPDANSYCRNSTISGKTGWRLPTSTELKALYDSRLLMGQGWTLGFVWTSTLDTRWPDEEPKHYYVNLTYGDVNPFIDSSKNSYTCVHES